MRPKTSRDLTAGLRRLATASVPAQNLERHWGVIQGVSADSTVTLTIGGSSAVVTGVKVLSSYSPVAGDTVMLDIVGSDVVVVGTLGVGRGPLGVLPGGYVAVTTSQGPAAPPFDISGASVSVPVATGRRIRVTGVALISSSVGTDVVKLQIAEGGSVLAERQYPQNQSDYISHVIVGTAAGIHSYRLRADRAAGSGNLSNNVISTFLTYLMVEDLGAVM